ncbi:C13 family peptidase [Dyella terrae]|uniref:C13 family peptidase n=1 Tax=Dyella terrae TaxID=522259 RepID=UPI001EFD0174|nr:C13 family peptidase [Dyella terrae]ULU24141.1 caspase family protein [Dyella terrae]
MRTALTALLAFAAGVLLMVGLSHHAPPAPAAGALEQAAQSTTAPAPASTAETDDDNSPSDNWPQQAPSPEQVMYAQRNMVHKALAELGPRTPGRPNLYVVAFGGDGGEDVFRNEAEYAAKMFPERFGHDTHVVVLENNPGSLERHPLASWSNLEETLDGIASLMKPDEDILLLYLTTHGGEDHTLLVDMDPLPLDQIGTDDLSGILSKRPFKWKVVVVNACYSGGFVPSLQGPGTLVITAARADRSSFGCGSDSDITYFGHAWLVDGLNHTTDFMEAYRQASSEIAKWETKDKLTPSEPQMSVGTGIAEQLALWRKHITPGPVVAFKPAVPATILGRPGEAR